MVDHNNTNIQNKLEMAKYGLIKYEGILKGIKKELTKKKRASSVYTRVRRGLYFPSEKTGLRI